VGVLLDTPTWGSSAVRRRAAAAGSDTEGSTALLRASGWRVLPVRAGENLPDRWHEASRHLTDQLSGARS
jgi:hypothetical protein